MKSSHRWGALVLLVAIIAAACGASSTTQQLPDPDGTPASLDGLWLLDQSSLTLDIDLATAAVDGRTNCARLLGSLTYQNQGEQTSFSLPGRSNSGCSPEEIDDADRLNELLETVASSEAVPGGFVLFDESANELGRLLVGG